MSEIVRMMKVKKELLLLLFLVLVGGLILGRFYWLHLQYMPVDPHDKNYIDVFIPENSTARDIAGILYEEKLIRSREAFLYYCKKTGYDSRLKAGHFRFSRSQSLKEIARDIAEGKVVMITFTIPEGYTVEQIGDIVVKKGLCSREEWEEALRKDYDYPFLAEVPSGVKNRLEGFLFPDTYVVGEGITASELVAMMLQNFANIWERDFAREAEGKSIYQIVTIASMVEREAVVPSERARIAGVIFNRMRAGMPLQIDATVLYALGKHKEIVTYDDLKVDSPYNTYQITGLPLGPIACPGREAIKAVLNPEKHDYLYYVARGDGSHHFSRTYAEHLAAIARYQKR
ncbi:UPF0755 protein [Thermosyntropha lipolytica DSM 11003]|uniref:Endolytic murein transglycosylase n=1 Tax=Thermosyntropha lipolytica DSM 11003 TaxID=1123382 RepID=A0A1M5MVD6_9FIRM|nr:endolytic transglycosylase MltG [Thermosyntropha lipolytica]SHG81310.1 UPF0755 protein [Thermosyntropha lipolytica DSM 11003]